MLVRIEAKVFLDDRLGRLVKGQVVDLPEHKAQFFIDRGDLSEHDSGARAAPLQAPAPKTSKKRG